MRARKRPAPTDRPPRNYTNADSLSETSVRAPGKTLVWVPCTWTHPQDVPSQLKRRRTAAQRLAVLESGRADPWHYDPPTAGYAEAAAHLLGAGLLPAPNQEGLRVMWVRGGHSRQAAKLIAQRWERAS